MARFLGQLDSQKKHRLRAIWTPAFSNRGRNGSTETLWLWHGKTHTDRPAITLAGISDILINFDVIQRSHTGVIFFLSPYWRTALRQCGRWKSDQNVSSMNSLRYCPNYRSVTFPQTRCGPFLLHEMNAQKRGTKST